MAIASRTGAIGATGQGTFTLVTDALLIETLVVIAASIAATDMLAWARVPPVLGYLLAGLLIGPHGLQILAAGAETKFLAELGVIFLMFMVGLEFSIPAMFDARRDVLGAGGLQVGITTLAVAGLHVGGSQLR